MLDLDGSADGIVEGRFVLAGDEVGRKNMFEVVAAGIIVLLGEGDALLWGLSSGLLAKKKIARSIRKPNMPASVVGRNRMKASSGTCKARFTIIMLYRLLPR